MVGYLERVSKWGLTQALEARCRATTLKSWSKTRPNWGLTTVITRLGRLKIQVKFKDTVKLMHNLNLGVQCAHLIQIIYIAVTDLAWVWIVAKVTTMGPVWVVAKAVASSRACKCHRSCY